MIKVIWISLHPPYSKANSAGWQTFNYYYNLINTDIRFDVRLIALCEKVDQTKVEQENKANNCKFIYRNDPAISKLKKISNVESSYSPFNRHANLMSNYLTQRIIESLQEYKDEQFYPDIVILEWTQNVILVKDVKKIFPNAKCVASEHDVTFVAYKRKSVYFSGLNGIKWKWKAFWEKRIELNALNLCALTLPQNPDNIDLLKEERIKSELRCLVPYFNNMKDCNRRPNGKDILFFGAMGRPENYLSAIWFIEEVMPLLSDVEMRFVVLGSNPPEQLKAYSNDRVFVTGFVDSTLPYFEEACCLVAPLLLGAGIKVKILEGLSSGIPVITNDIGIEGIAAQDGVVYIHAEKPEEIAASVRMALSGKLETIGQAGRNYIQENYNIQKSVEDYKSALISLVEENE